MRLTPSYLIAACLATIAVCALGWTSRVDNHPYVIKCSQDYYISKAKPVVTRRDCSQIEGNDCNGGYIWLITFGK